MKWVWSIRNDCIDKSHTNLYVQMWCVCVPYLKLLSELRRVALRVNLQHLLIGECKLINGDGSLSTQTGLQDGIMDEHILLLRDGQQGKITKSHKALAALMSLLTVNWPLVRTMPNLITAAECWQIAIAVKPSFTPSCPLLGIVSEPRHCI